MKKRILNYAISVFVTGVIIFVFDNLAWWLANEELTHQEMLTRFLAIFAVLSCVHEQLK